MTITELKTVAIYQDEEKGIIDEEFDEEKADEGIEELVNPEEEKIDTGDDNNIEE